MSFRVDLDTYRGPLDLLLYLVRKHEIDILEIPIAVVTTQFLDYLAILEELDPNAVGDFLELASTLIEIKSRMILPQSDEEHEPLEDPRHELVERLLEYKKYRDVSSMLEERGRLHQQSYSRLANDLEPRRVDPSEQPIREVELWDIVSAMGRIIRQTETPAEATIVYDDTPIQVYMQDIHQRLIDKGRIGISETFRPGMHKSALIGVFLAILELVRHHSVIADQADVNSEIWIHPGPRFSEFLDLSDVDTYEHGACNEPSESLSTG